MHKKIISLSFFFLSCVYFVILTFKFFHVLAQNANLFRLIWHKPELASDWEEWWQQKYKKKKLKKKIRNMWGIYHRNEFLSPCNLDVNQSIFIRRKKINRSINQWRILILFWFFAKTKSNSLFLFHLIQSIICWHIIYFVVTS